MEAVQLRGMPALEIKVACLAIAWPAGFEASLPGCLADLELC